MTLGHGGRPRPRPAGGSHLFGPGLTWQGRRTPAARRPRIPGRQHGPRPSHAGGRRRRRAAGGTWAFTARSRLTGRSSAPPPAPPPPPPPPPAERAPRRPTPMARTPSLRGRRDPARRPLPTWSRSLRSAMAVAASAPIASAAARHRGVSGESAEESAGGGRCRLPGRPQQPPKGEAPAGPALLRGLPALFFPFFLFPSAAAPSRRHRRLLTPLSRNTLAPPRARRSSPRQRRYPNSTPQYYHHRPPRLAAARGRGQSKPSAHWPRRRAARAPPRRGGRAARGSGRGWARSRERGRRRRECVKPGEGWPGVPRAPGAEGGGVGSTG